MSRYLEELEFAVSQRIGRPGNGSQTALVMELIEYAKKLEQELDDIRMKAVSPSSQDQSRCPLCKSLKLALTKHEKDGTTLYYNTCIECGWMSQNRDTISQAMADIAVAC